LPLGDCRELVHFDFPASVAFRVSFTKVKRNNETPN
jgi:hypothetical protein